VAAAREALGCGELARILEAVEQPMTPGRFIRNIGVSLSTARFRLPPDPIAARDELCR
jgi:arabinofuranosyltransferase